MMITCKICGYETEKSLQAHLNCKHNLINKEYLEIYPDSVIYSQSYRDRLVYTSEHRDPIYKKKISKNSKKLFQNPEWVEKFNKTLKIAQNTPQAKENHRKGALNYYKNISKEQAEYHRRGLISSWKNPDVKINRVKVLKEAHSKQEARENHSKAAKKYYNSLTPQEKEIKRQKLKETWALPENREKILNLSKIGLKAAMSEKGVKNRNLANLKPEVIEKRRQNRIKAMQRQPTYSSLNIKFKKVLNKMGVFPESEYNIGPYIVDFCFVDKKIIVEVDGDYWHGNPEVYIKFNKIQEKTINKDKRENSYCKNHGWTLLRFWEKDINNNINQCVKKIQEVLNG